MSSIGDFELMIHPNRTLTVDHDSTGRFLTADNWNFSQEFTNEVFDLILPRLSGELPNARIVMDMSFEDYEASPQEVAFFLFTQLREQLPTERTITLFGRMMPNDFILTKQFVEPWMDALGGDTRGNLTLSDIHPHVMIAGLSEPVVGKHYAANLATLVPGRLQAREHAQKTLAEHEETEEFTYSFPFERVAAVEALAKLSTDIQIPVAGMFVGSPEQQEASVIAFADSSFSKFDMGNEVIRRVTDFADRVEGDIIQVQDIINGCQGSDKMLDYALQMRSPKEALSFFHKAALICGFVPGFTPIAQLFEGNLTYLYEIMAALSQRELAWLSTEQWETLASDDYIMYGDGAIALELL